MSWVDRIGLVAAIVLPLWNIPLIARVVRRKTSQDISIWWVTGVWICILLMAPSGFYSDDVVWRTFNYVNVVLFSGVFVTVLKYRGRPGDGRERPDGNGTGQG